jgi:hypothetical protein
MQCAWTFISSVVWSVLHYFSILSLNGTVFETVRCCSRCVFWSSLQHLLKQFSFLEELSEIGSIMYIGLCAKCPLFVSAGFNETWIYWTDFRKILRNQISWRSIKLEPSSVRPSGPTVRRTDGRTDGRTDTQTQTWINSRFPKFFERA